ISALPGEFVRTYLTTDGACLAMTRASGVSKGSVRSLGTLTDPEPPQSSTIFSKLLRSRSEMSTRRSSPERCGRDVHQENESFHEEKTQRRSTFFQTSELNSSLSISEDSLEEAISGGLGGCVAQHKLVWIAS
ncbi:unnamed protein product, partial [Lymnaea stagnalis]